MVMAPPFPPKWNHRAAPSVSYEVIRNKQHRRVRVVVYALRMSYIRLENTPSVVLFHTLGARLFGQYVVMIGRVRVRVIFGEIRF